MKPIRFLPKIKRGQVCLNCQQPLSGEENFCPNCGQRNDVSQLNFGQFLHAIFSEIISYDSRLWRTIGILILKPGKVSKDFIEGKRAQYANPFRFYLTISIVFFLIIGVFNKYDELTHPDTNQTQLLNINTTTPKIKIPKNNNPLVDSIIKANTNDKDLKNAQLELDSVIKSKPNSFSNKIKNDIKFYQAHKDLSVDQALDSLKQTKTFWNRFYYTKVIDGTKVFQDKGKSLNKKIVSYLSIALFIFLPIFAMFLKLLYIRRHLNYMEHLVFVFNTQSVFFILMILVSIINLFSKNTSAIAIFVVMFLIYLYLALLQFYKQGWFKTFVKFILMNTVYLTLSVIGLGIVSVLAFLIG